MPAFCARRGSVRKCAAAGRVDYLDLPKDRRSSLYLVMPYYRGVDARRAAENRAAGFADRRQSASPLNLCDAIEDLSARQVMHRDIKPENIFLLTSGEVKLLDLGLAALPGHRRRRSATTSAAPRATWRRNCSRARRPVRAAKYFRSGVTLYRMFSGGDFPFGRDESWPLARARPDLPPWLGRAIGQAIQTRPGNALSRTPQICAAALEHGPARMTIGADRRRRARDRRKNLAPDRRRSSRSAASRLPVETLRWPRDFRRPPPPASGIRPRQRAGPPVQQSGLSSPSVRDRRSGPRGSVAVVADGLGGHKGGREAAETTVRAFIDGYFGAAEHLSPRTGGVPRA